MAVPHEMMHRHEFDGGNSEASQMLDHRLGCQTAVGPAQVLGNLGMKLCESLYVGLIDDGLSPWTA